MTLQQLVDAIRPHLPNLQVDEDLDGQLIIYTNMKVQDGDILTSYESN